MELKEILKNKKFVILIAVFLMIAIGIMIALLFKNNGTTNYPNDPILLDNIGTSDTNLDIESQTTLDSGDYIVYTNEAISISVQTFMSNIGVDYSREETSDENVEKWTSGESFVLFDKTNNYLQLSFEDPLNTEYNLTTNSGIASWMEKYFSINGEYEITNTEIQEDGKKYIYANMKLDNINLEFKERDDKSSVFFILDSTGNILSGSILLLNFVESNYTVPVIGPDELSSYIDNELYPKEIIPDFSGVYESIDLSYLSNDWIEIEGSLDNCSVVSGELVYLYTNSEQEYLLPSYKLESVCEVTYEGEIYSVPSTVYTNAVDPDYVSIGE